MTTNDELLKAIRMTFGMDSAQATEVQKKLRQGKEAAIGELRKQLRALPDAAMVGMEAASIYLEISMRSLKRYAENDPRFAPTSKGGKGRGKSSQYSIEKLRGLEELLVDLDATKWGRDGKRTLEFDADEFNPTVLAQLSKKHRIVKIYIDVFTLDGDATSFMLVGLREAILEHVWDEPGVHNTWYESYREALRMSLSEKFLEAFARTEREKLRDSLADM